MAFGKAFGWRCVRVTAASMIASLGVDTSSGGVPLPPGFIDRTVATNFEQLVGVGFAPLGGVASGRLFAWEKGGKVWTVENGVKSAQPLLDISEEVGNWGDYGMLGFAADPNFSTNGYIYVSYVVDYYYLTNFGLPGYDPAANMTYHDTIARITRYTCNPGDGFRSVNYSSRNILVGETITTGMAIMGTTHGVGALLFGTDGTLLASIGDGASAATVDVGVTPKPDSSNTARADGIITAAQDIGAYRSQYLGSLNGKVLRLDPATGNGVASNPFFDAAEPRAPRSRVWTLGLRNPFRMTMRPGTGSTNPADADPGTLYIGDVGWNLWEELNVASTGGQNFGWPVYEGMVFQTEYINSLVPQNPDTPNPLFGVNGCTQEKFTFRDLLVLERRDHDEVFPNPCNELVEVPVAAPRFVYRRPTAAWFHDTKAFVPYFLPNGNSTYALVGEPGSPCLGDQFGGSASVGGAWYTGTEYPAPYANSYFHADYTRRWLKSFTIDSGDRATEIRNMIPDDSAVIVCITADPVSGDLHYVSYDDIGMAAVHRISYVGGTNQPPTAVATATPRFGPSPLPVQLNGLASTDPENAALTYLWDFGDSTPPSRQAAPLHVFTDDTDLTGLGTFVAKVFSLVPPNPIGGGNQDPEIMRNLVYPDLNEGDSKRQYDTFHQGDQGNNDWIGYTFASPQTLRGLIFQEGRQFLDGGWFDELNVEARIEGVWVSLPYASTPSYPGANSVGFESFELRLGASVVADGIRIQGVPGGASRFISVGELRVLGAPATTGPVCRTVKLTVTDDVNFSGTTTLKVAVNNTPPVIEITSPPLGFRYSSYVPTIISLTANISDAQHPLNQLTCRWQSILHHNTHQHPDPADMNCVTSAYLYPHGSAEDVFFYEIKLTVTDPDCLSTTASVFLYPAVCRSDFNADGFVTGEDFDGFVDEFELGGPGADYDLNGFVTGDDFDAFVAAFETGC